MTVNFEALWDLIDKIASQEKNFNASLHEKQKSLFEAIRKFQKQEKQLEEVIFEKIRKEVKSRNFSDLVDDLTENLLKQLGEYLYNYDLDAHLPQKAQDTLSESRKKHLAEQNIFKQIYLNEFLLENRHYKLLQKTFIKLKESTLKQELFGFYGRVYELEQQLAHKKILESPKLITDKEFEQTLKKFFEISQKIHALKPQKEVFPETERVFEQIKEALKEKLQQQALQEDVFTSVGIWLDSNLKRIEQDTEQQFFRKDWHKNSAQLSFYHLLLLYMQVCEKANLKIANFEEILQLKADNRTFLTGNILDKLFCLNIRIRQYFEAYKSHNLPEMERILGEIRALKRDFVYSENLFFTSLGYFLENLVFGLEHRFILEVLKDTPTLDAYELLEMRSQRIEENLQIFSQKAISNLIWRHHLNTVLLNFRLCYFNNQPKEYETCLNSLEQLCELGNFDKKYPQYFVETNLMKALLLKSSNQEIQVEEIFRKLEKKQNSKEKVLEQTKSNFFRVLKKILLDNKEPTLTKSCQKHRNELENLQAQTLLQQAMIDFLKQSLPEKDKYRYERFNALLEPMVFVEQNRQADSTTAKINHYQNSILSYCTYLQNQDWERWKTLFPKVVHKYILLYDHSIEHIVENMSNFFRKRKHILYQAKIEELLVKIHGDMAIVPIFISWQHGNQEPYEAWVETRFYFDSKRKIKVVEELKILSSKGIF